MEEYISRPEEIKAESLVYKAFGLNPEIVKFCDTCYHCKCECEDSEEEDVEEELCPHCETDPCICANQLTLES